MRERKTKEPCLKCFLHKDRCICEGIPRLSLHTRISLVVHAKELKRTTNTGRLAIEALTNSQMYVRGLGTEALDLSSLISSDYETVLLYPSEEASELTPEYVQQLAKPIHLIVPDGNWRQASKVHYRHKELEDVPRVFLKNPNPSQHHMRLETVPEGMATLEAIAHAITVIEGAEAGDQLMSVYRAKLENTLIGRGTITSLEAFLP
jgi:DTW domain-containing protein YfiP